MTFYWLYDLPNALFCLITVGALLAFGVAGLYLTRGAVRRLHQVDHSHNDIVSYFLAAITVFYGITLGLVAIGTWTTYSDIGNKTDAEAQTVASLYRDVVSYDEPWRSALRGDLREYTRYVIDIGWPQQRQGIVPTGSGIFLEHFQDHLLSYKPTTISMEIVQAEVFKQYNVLVENRRARLNAVTTGLPSSIWSLVIFGALISIVVTWFFDTKSFGMHVWMTSTLAGFLGMMIFLVGTLDNPFRGKVSIDPSAMTQVYDQLMK